MAELVIISTFYAFVLLWKLLKYSEDYGNFDGACSVSLIAGGGLLLDNEDGITVTTEAQKNELVLALSNIESCKVSTYKPSEQGSLYYISYWCELHVDDDPINFKIAKLTRKVEEISQALKVFGTKYPKRYINGKNI